MWAPSQIPTRELQTVYVCSTEIKGCKPDSMTTTLNHLDRGGRGHVLHLSRCRRLRVCLATEASLPGVNGALGCRADRDTGFDVGAVVGGILLQ